MHIFGMNVWKQSFLFVVVLLFCIASLSAQPSICPTPFNPLRTCNSHYISEEFVFVGRLISVTEKATEINGTMMARARVSVEEPIKGNLSKRTFELFLQLLSLCHEGLEIGESRIYTASNRTIDGLNKLVSTRWSANLKDISDGELKNLLNGIRSVTKGIKQPRIVGKVVRYDSNPLGIYDFQGKSLDTKLGYNPQYSYPLKEVGVIAKPVDENLNPVKQNSYQTKTNLNGSYEFKDLPKGWYELFLKLPEDLYVEAFMYRLPSHEDTFFDPPFRTREKKKIYVNVGNGICSEDIRFNVRPAGKIKGKLIFENEIPSETPLLELFWVDSETQRNDLKGVVDYSFDIYKSKSNPEDTLEFLFSDLQVGKYILKIVFDTKDEQKNLYYPGVKEIKDAEIINIKAGENKDISIKIK